LLEVVRLRVIDLRAQPKGCSEHPLIRLKNDVISLNKGEVLRVITDEEVVPLEAIRVIAYKAGLTMEIARAEKGATEVVLRKE
jgi:TusA-related sulfurtransferase